MSAFDEMKDEEGDVPITADNAIVVIAQELRGIRHLLWQVAFDPNCETVLDRINTTLHDTLQTFEGHKDESSRTIADHVRDLAER